jgi:glycerophosphoryl diester phosphodiesterase
VERSCSLKKQSNQPWRVHEWVLVSLNLMSLSPQTVVCRVVTPSVTCTQQQISSSSRIWRRNAQFTPAKATSPANALYCTSDITIAEYTSLCGKQDGFNASATNVQDYQYGTPVWRTELYDACGTVMTLDSYITLVESLLGHRNFTPELKTPPAQVPRPFKGYTQEQYAREMLDTFIKRGIAPNRVWAQSSNPPDIFQWLKEYPDFGKQAIYLDEDGDTPDTYITAVARLASLKKQGVNIISPPFGYFLTSPDNKTIIPSS